MKPITVSPFALVALAFVAGCSGSSKEDPFLSIKGEWSVVELNESGKVAPSSQLSRMTVTLRNGKFQRIETGAGTSKADEELAVTLDSAKNPATIDLVQIEGESQGKSRLGIYAVEGNTLKMSLADNGVPRPTDFGPDSRITYMVLQRKQ